MPVVTPVARLVGYVRKGEPLKASKREACSKIRVPCAFGRCSPHAEHVVDRPDVEAPRGVELTGTNGRGAIYHAPTAACGIPGDRERMVTKRGTTKHRVHPPVPGPPPGTIPHPSGGKKN